MTWYTASVITAIQKISASQESIPVFEDFFLIEAKSHSEALKKAETIGQEHAATDDNLSLNGDAAKRIFLGIRKIRSIYNPSPFDIDEEKPVSGTELSHSYFEVENIEIAKKLASGNSVDVCYLDDSDD